MGEKRAATKLTAEEILTSLNEALVAERQAVADYAAHAETADSAEIREALAALRDVEREHALRLAQRISALGSWPTSSSPDANPARGDLAQQLAWDLEGEQWAIVEYARLIAGIVDDEGTVELMTELLLDEMRHAAWLKSTLRTLLGEE
jgi:bacterioferritin (cytochrome b1)